MCPVAADVFTNDIPRDGWGRPLIYPAPAKCETHADVVARFAADKKRPPAYRRTTKFIGVLDDTYNLELWQMRMVALGMGQRSDLVLAAASLTDAREDKKALDAVARQAKEHARASSKATTGTALHKFVERLDRGQQLGNVPEPFDKDLDAYVATRDRYGLTYGLIEAMRVFDPWQVAGTPDRTVCYRGKWFIGDVKTGSLEWSEREIAMQLALYARSTPYDTDRGRYGDIPPVDRRKAIVIHLPAGQAKCELHWVDIEAGWEGCQNAKAVWDWRQRKGLFVPFDDPDAPPSYASHLERNAAQPNVYDKAMQCQTLDELRDLWRRVAELPGGIDDAFRAAAMKRKQQLEGAA